MSGKKDSFRHGYIFFVLWNCCVMELLCKGSGCIILEDCYNEAVLRWGWF